LPADLGGVAGPRAGGESVACGLDPGPAGAGRSGAGAAAVADGGGDHAGEEPDSRVAEAERSAAAGGVEDAVGSGVSGVVEATDEGAAGGSGSGVAEPPSGVGIFRRREAGIGTGAAGCGGAAALSGAGGGDEAVEGSGTADGDGDADRVGGSEPVFEPEAGGVLFGFDPAAVSERGGDGPFGSHQPAGPGAGAEGAEPGGVVGGPARTGVGRVVCGTDRGARSGGEEDHAHRGDAAAGDLAVAPGADGAGGLKEGGERRERSRAEAWERR